jgi:hypothetical protein
LGAGDGPVRDLGRWDVLVDLTEKERLFLLLCVDLVDREVVGWKMKVSEYERKKIEWSLQEKINLIPDDPLPAAKPAPVEEL